MDFAITPSDRMQLAYASPHRRGYFLVFSHAMEVWEMAHVKMKMKPTAPALVVLPGGILGGEH